MKKLISLALILMLAVLVAVVSGCGDKKEEAAKSQGPKTVRLAGTLPIGHHLTQAIELVKKEVETKTNGQLKMDLYPAMQLYADKDMVEVIPQGGLEITQTNMGFWTGKVPGLAIFNMHLLFDGKEHFYAVEDDPEMVEFLDKQLQQKANTKLIAVLDYGQNGPIATVPIRKMEDLKGLKMRGDSEYATHFMKALGAAPVLLSSGEVYDALSKKVIDGAISGPSSFVDRKWYEVAYYPVTNFFNETLHALICNLDWWNSLPKEQQAILMEAGKKARDFTRVEAKKAEDEGWAKLKAMPKMELITLSDAEMKRWADIVVPYEEKILIKAIGEQEYKRLRAIVEKHRKPAAK